MRAYCSWCNGTGKEDFLFGIFKTRCPVCFGSGQIHASIIDKWTVNYKPDFLSTDEEWEYYKKYTFPTVNQIRDKESKQKEVDEMTHTKPSVTNRPVKPVTEKFKIGEDVLNTRQGKFYGHVGRVEDIDSHAIYIRDESGEVYKVGVTWIDGELRKLQRPKQAENDSPTKPSHYGKLDVFTYAKEHFTVEEVKAYHQITAIKYITRAGKKDGNPFEQDIKKAITHLQECLKGEEG